MRFIFIIAACLLAWPIQAGAVPLAPHKAAYELSLGEITGASRFTGVEGVVSRQVERTCDGWIVTEHMVLNILTRVGGVIDREVQFSAWESSDATRYRFAARVKSRAGGEDDRYMGRLEVDRPAGPGTAVYSVPEGRKENIPDGTYLPISHIRKLLSEARAGSKQVRFHIFDGTEEGGAELMSSVIAKRLEAGQGKPDRNGIKDPRGLATGAAWRINAAFFEKPAEQTAPSFEISMELLDNGVPRNMVLDLGDFTIRQRLKEIEPLPAPEC